MSFGFGVLRLSSADFWRLSPRELNAASQAFAAREANPPARAVLEALAAAFPDQRSE